MIFANHFETAPLPLFRKLWKIPLRDMEVLGDGCGKQPMIL